MIILSSTIDPEDFSRAKKYDVVAQFVSKPLSVENLTELKENDFVKDYFNCPQVNFLRKNSEYSRLI